MTNIYNNPADFADDALAGFVELHSATVRAVTGGVVRRSGPERKVAVVVGGGSGHYPAFEGLVGSGFADGAVLGNLFTSPSSHYAYAVATAASRGEGVVFAYGNYAGDGMNFDLASEQLQQDGIAVRTVRVTDDIASAATNEVSKRRGIAGDFVVFKILSAAAESGFDLETVTRLGALANDRTRTLGVAFSGCTFPGAEEPLFTVPNGYMGIGLGIHGEPGLSTERITSASELAELLVVRVLAEAPANNTGRVAVVLNGLGATKYGELFLLWGCVAPMLRAAGLTLVDPEVGELVTSLEMAGVSLTVTWLDDELEPLWVAPAYTPAYKKGNTETALLGQTSYAETSETSIESRRPGSASSHADALSVLALLRAAQAVIHDRESELGRIDSIAGDGDHGRGMVRGLDYAVDAAEAACSELCGAGTTLRAAGNAWLEFAGGTSGVLWGSALVAFGNELGDDETVDQAGLLRAVGAFHSRIVTLGRAKLGDKTMVDAIEPFARTFAEHMTRGTQAAGVAAAEAATIAAAESAALLPLVGRARPHAQKSLGTPDAGATSFALIVSALFQASVADTLQTNRRNQS